MVAIAALLRSRRRACKGASLSLAGQQSYASQRACCHVRLPSAVPRGVPIRDPAGPGARPGPTFPGLAASEWALRWVSPNSDMVTPRPRLPAS
ncbi:hypothetical protein PsYK624_169410 [Phanerochaete sordida]|uniref:Uncharacterized protein n=1 Tax=Phanerochaete sordida TaxID=48140 RepID=A0A9P3LNT8_9APHY|nr:hypothetical protein PsYK624_169410 [Phanerochaete sordida]